MRDQAPKHQNQLSLDLVTHKESRPSSRGDNGAGFIDPVAHFSRWAYVIRPELYSALGITLREYVDKEKTRAARAAAKSKGLSKTEVRNTRVQYLAYAASRHPALSFREGDLFHSCGGTRPSLQVFENKNQLEVHAITSAGVRLAYLIDPSQLAAWLQSGDPPDTRHRIDRWESVKQVLHRSIGEWPEEQ